MASDALRRLAARLSSTIIISGGDKGDSGDSLEKSGFFCPQNDHASGDSGDNPMRFYREISVARHPSEHTNQPQRLPSAPAPSADSSRDGMEGSRAMARRYLPDAVRLLAGIAFGRDSEAALHTKMLAAKQIVDIAGVIPQATPTPPQPHDANNDGGESAMTECAATELAVQRRRESRREETTVQIKLLAEMLPKYLPAGTFFTALENRPISRVSGMLQKRRGVRSGIPDVYVLYLGKSIFVELKSRRGVASEPQKQIRAELLAAGGVWWIARSVRAAMMALHLSGVVFCRPWEPPRLEPWEGPFADPHQRLPQAPDVAAERSAALKRWRARRKAAREAAKLAAERDDAADADTAA